MLILFDGLEQIIELWQQVGIQRGIAKVESGGGAVGMDKIGIVGVVKNMIG